MRKTIAAVTAGLLLVAGQAAAAGSNSATVRIADRVGSTMQDGGDAAGIPWEVIVLGSVVVITAVVVANDDSSESD